MNPGSLDTLITLLQPREQRSPSGAVEILPQPVGDVWAHLRNLPARDQVAAGAERFTAAFELTVRTEDLTVLTTRTGALVEMLGSIHHVVADAPYRDNPRSGYTVLTVIRRSPQPTIGTTS